jgi:signal transduction histidine kinase
MAIRAEASERPKSRQALDALASRLIAAARTARIGVYERNADNTEIWWSEVMFEIFGQDPAVFRPSTESWLAVIHPRDRGRVLEFSRSSQHQGKLPGIRFRIRRSDGTIRHVEATRSLAEPENEAPEDPGMSRFGLVIDVTGQVESEEREYLLQRRLRESAHQAGMAEIAAGVLHNVGNVLNSLGVANSTARRIVKGLRLNHLEQAISLLHSNRARLAAFVTEGERGQHVLGYLGALVVHFSSNIQTIQTEMDTIDQLLHHLRHIISTQQATAWIGGPREPVNLQELAEAALLMQATAHDDIDIVRIYEASPSVTTNRHKLLQILVNVVSNASDAIGAKPTQRGRIAIRMACENGDAVVSVEDSGVGMSEDVLSRLWRFGFTTKENGHGFGLHNCANAAREIGATIGAQSDGPGRGSRFTIRLPLADEPPHSSGVAT